MIQGLIFLNHKEGSIFVLNNFLMEQDPESIDHWLFA